MGRRGHLAYVSGVTHKKEQVEHISIEEQWLSDFEVGVVAHQ